MKRPGWEEEWTPSPGPGSPLTPWAWALLGWLAWMFIQTWPLGGPRPLTPLDQALTQLAERLDPRADSVIWVGDSRLRHALPEGPVMRETIAQAWSPTGRAVRMRRLTVPWLDAPALETRLARLVALQPGLVVLQLEVLLPPPFHPALRDPAAFGEPLDLEGGGGARGARVRRLWEDRGFSVSPEHAAAGVRLLTGLQDSGVPVVLVQLPQSETVRDLARPGYAEAQAAAARTLFDAPVVTPLATAPDHWFKDQLHMTPAGAEAFGPGLLSAVFEARP